MSSVDKHSPFQWLTVKICPSVVSPGNIPVSEDEISRFQTSMAPASIEKTLKMSEVRHTEIHMNSKSTGAQTCVCVDLIIKSPHRSFWFNN